MDTQANGLYPAIMAALLFVSFLLLMIISSVLKQFKYRIWELRYYLKREMDSIESERERISQNLHDQIGSGLSGIGILLQSLQEKYNDPLLKKAIQFISSQHRQVQTISRELYPSVIKEMGLIRTLEDLIEEFRTYSNCTIHTNIQINDTSLGEATTVHIYRIIREILTNTIKHAKADTLLLHCREVKDYLIIYLEDNGIGFDVKSVKSTSKGLGLMHIESRINGLGGRCSINSNLGKGTSFDIKIPLNQQTTHSNG